MLGDVVQLANNLWVVIGDMPADVPNALIYRKGDRLYLMDSGAGPTIKASILQMLHDAGPVQSFTLLNSHGHPDHVGNNDLIQLAQAKRPIIICQKQAFLCWMPAHILRRNFQNLVHTTIR